MSPPVPARAVEMGAMTWTELDAALHAGTDAVILMTASVEQNGPHLSLDKHVTLGAAVAVGVARRLERVLVAPVLPFGRAPEHRGFPGTFDLSDGLYTALLGELVDNLVATGFHRVVLMSDHGTNRDALARFAERARSVYAHRGVRLLTALACYDRADESMEPEIVAAGLAPPDSGHSVHAGLLDTSMLLALAPDRVRALPETPGPDAFDPVFEQQIRSDGLRAVSPTGVLGDPRRANAALGRRAFERLVTLCADEVRDALADVSPLETSGGADGGVYSNGDGGEGTRDARGVPPR